MKPQHSRKRDLVSENLRFAKRFISQNLSSVLLEQLRELNRNSSLSLRCGDLLLLNGGWYVTHTGCFVWQLVDGARVFRFSQFRHSLIAANARYAFKATVYKSRSCQGFVGLWRC